MQKPIVIDGDSMNLDVFIEVTRHDAPVKISEKAIESIHKSRAVVENLLAKKAPMYGINTGFGRFSDQAIPEDQIDLLQLNLIRADATGAGSPFPREIVRGALLLRANSLIKGFSGVRRELPETMVKMLNYGVHPVIPEKGSVGASGDLCPLAHMVLPMIGEGQAEYLGQFMAGAKALDMAGIAPLKLKAKEGLALINGTPVMTSIAAHVLYTALILQKSADIISALTFESLKGIIDAFDARIHEARGQDGQKDVAFNMREILKGSNWVSRQGELRIQDSYSLRCIPQVHGASRMLLSTLLK